MSAASFIGYGISAPTTFLVARWLGPTALGQAQYVLLFYFYAALLRTGTFEGGMRTYIHLSACGEREAAQRARDVSVSFETVASLIPGLAMVGLAVAMRDPTRRLGFYLAPVAVVLASVSSYYGGMFAADGRFREVASTNILRAVAAPIATLAGIKLVGAPAVFIAPMAGDALAIVSFSLRRPKLGIKPRFDRQTWAPLLRSGFPLGALGIVYWLYRLVGSTSVALARSATSFGIYTFAAAPVTALVGVIAGVHAVVTPAVWSEMAQRAGDGLWIPEARRITLALGMISAAATNLCQALFLPLVLLFLPKFVASARILEILAFNILLLSIGAIPSVLLQSTRVNRQARYLFIWAGLLGVNATANLVLLALGGGSIGVAVNDIWVQVAALVLTFWLAWRHLGGWVAWGRTVASLLAITVWCASVAVVIHAVDGKHNGRSELAFLVLRLMVVLAAWSPVLAVARRASLLRRSPAPQAVR
jgi:O-antigen/teichoic acid export membrane protein